MLASVAACFRPGQPLLIESDEHRPYPQAVLDLFGVTRFRRRRRVRGRRKHPDLKPPPGLWFAVVHKVRDACGNLLRVKTRRVFGPRRGILRLLKRLKLGRRINTGHIERLNGTMRTQQTRLARRTRNVSHASQALQFGLSLWRDLYHWTRPTARWAVVRQRWRSASPRRSGPFVPTYTIRCMSVTGSAPCGPNNAKNC